MKKYSIEELENLAAQCRRDSLRMIHAVSSGHPGGSLGCADLFVALYFEVLQHDPSFNMDGKGEDLFFLSNGHIAPIWYSVLARSGYFEVSELATLRKLDSRLQGHPATEEHLPGIRIASGSLGQGLSVSLGVAQTKKLNGDDRLVYTLMGDGEIQEGQVWEAAIYGAHHKVDNIIAMIDENGRQIDGDVDDVMALGDLGAKWEAFGWDVMRAEGNDMAKLIDSLNEAKSRTGKGKPVMILVKTEMGQGVDYMMGTHKWHGNSPNDEQLEDALNQLTTTQQDY